MISAQRECKHLACAASNTLPVDGCHRLLFVIRIQATKKRRQAYYSRSIISYILSLCQSSNVWKNNLVIDNKTASKIKITLMSYETSINKDLIRN